MSEPIPSDRLLFLALTDLRNVCFVGSLNGHDRCLVSRAIRYLEDLQSDVNGRAIGVDIPRRHFPRPRERKP